MRKMKFRTKVRLLIILTLLLIALTGYAAGKYMKTFPVDGTVTFSANLVAENGFSLVDTYADSETVSLIPGVDIVREPRVVITGKTDVNAFLFVEIVDTLDTADGTKLVDYDVTSNWLATDITGANGGTVYVYTGGGSEATALTGNPQNFDIPILEGGTLTVSQYVKSKDYTAYNDTDILKFYAVLTERVGFETPATAYARINP